MLDLLIGGFFFYQLFNGWYKGFIRMLLSFLIMAASLVGAAALAKLGGTFKANGLIIFLVFLLLFFVLRKILLYLVNKFNDFFNRIPVLGGINRFLGSLVGLLVAAFVVFTLARILGFMAPFSSDLQNLFQQSQILKFFHVWAG